MAIESQKCPEGRTIKKYTLLPDDSRFKKFTECVTCKLQGGRIRSDSHNIVIGYGIILQCKANVTDDDTVQIINKNK